MNVRLGNEQIVHSVQSGGCTDCGIMYGDPTSMVLVAGYSTEDPVDCMVCMVQETRGPTDKFHFKVTLTVPMPVLSYTVVLNKDPKK